MSKLRAALTFVVAALLAVGYASSQTALFRGDAAAWAYAVDSQPVRVAAAIVLLACVGFALVREQETGGNQP